MLHCEPFALLPSEYLLCLPLLSPANLVFQQNDLRMDIFEI